jgi:hypothetical protein
VSAAGHPRYAASTAKKLVQSVSEASSSDAGGGESDGSGVAGEGALGSSTGEGSNTSGEGGWALRGVPIG